MNKKQIKNFLMILVVASAGGSLLINLHNGFEKWVWQLCTLVWVANSYLLEKEIEKSEQINN
jgi:hypothetical protein